MNKSRFNAVFSGLTSIAKKVYEAVPASEPWSASQITTEMTRITGSMTDRRVVDGALRGMVDVGIVSYPRPGVFIRVAIREEKLAKPVNSQSKEKTSSAEVLKLAQAQKQIKPILAIEKLAAVASRAMDISTSLKQLANDIEAAAIEIDEQSKADKSDTEKLKQLQSLLRSLG